MAKSLARSFAGGELAPTLFGRLDLAKYQTGLQKCLNFIVTPQGPIENRPGFEYVLKTKDGTACLIPFSYNSDQTFALEFGDEYIRFHTDGATLLEPPKTVVSVTSAAPGVFEVTAHGYSAGDWVYLAAMGNMPELTGRYGIVANATTDTFTLADLFGDAINTGDMGAYSGGGNASRVYEIASPYVEADIFDLHYVQSADVLTIVHPNYEPMELRRVSATSWTLTAISFVPTIETPAAPGIASSGPGGGTPIDHTYVTTALAENTLEESLASPSDDASIDLTVVGNALLITPNAVSGAVRYNVYKLKGGIFGYIGQTDGSALTDDGIEPDMSKTPPLARDPFASDYPHAVSYFEQRRAFGGTSLLPQSLWLTRSGTESNMSYSIPSQDDDAISARIVAREAQVIRHLIPLGDLLALTSGGVWRLSPTGGEALVPSNISPKAQSYVGASNVQPVVTSDSVLYAPHRGNQIREIAYKWETQRYSANNIAVLAPHLFDYFSIVQLAYSNIPYQAMWAVRGDGKLLGLTHQPEHDVRAWHQHDTQGSFESVCAIAESDQDGVYAVVRREINGQTVRYIERMHSRNFTALEDAFFVDAGLTYDGDPTDTITGLWHLEGEEVTALADGGVEPVQTVTGGAITLSAEASTVHIGLAYNCDAQTMPVALEAAAAFGQGTQKNINEVALRVYQASGIQAGPSFDKLREYPQRTTSDEGGAPPGMVTGIAQFKQTPDWQRNGTICVRQANPLPLTLLSMTLETAAGG